MTRPSGISPYKVESNSPDKLILRSNQTRTRSYSSARDCLQKHILDGPVVPEFALAPPDGVKASKIIWISPDWWTETEATGDPSMLTPGTLCRSDEQFKHRGGEADPPPGVGAEEAGDQRGGINSLL